MIEFYPQIKSAHVALAFASGALFTLRGAGVLGGWRWPMAWPLRWSSYAIDTALLTAALMLLSFLPSGFFANGWLVVKLALLVLYIVLGTFALRRARQWRMRALCYVAALATYLWVVGIALAHHPLGPLRGLAGG
jgi:uncharacterized membrane protein SirB2